MLVDAKIATSYLMRKNQRTLKNSVISEFMKKNDIKGWPNDPMGKSRWIHFPDEKIVLMYEKRLYSFCKKYHFITDKDQISRIIYFFELSFVRTLARKYQMSSKKIFSTRVIRKREYLLLYNEKTNSYTTHFCKKKIYSIFVMKN